MHKLQGFLPVYRQSVHQPLPSLEHPRKARGSGGRGKRRGVKFFCGLQGDLWGNWGDGASPLWLLRYLGPSLFPAWRKWLGGTKGERLLRCLGPSLFPAWRKWLGGTKWEPWGYEVRFQAVGGVGEPFGGKRRGAAESITINVADVVRRLRWWKKNSTETVSDFLRRWVIWD